jgi:hypothetical protein
MEKFTLAGLKRRLSPGTTIYLRECLTGWVEPSGAARTVAEMRSNSVTFKRAGFGSLSYLDFPAANLVRETPDGFAIYEPARLESGSNEPRSVLAARYTWAAPAADEARTVRGGDWQVEAAVNDAKLKAAVSSWAALHAAGIERDHALGLLGERFAWAVTAGNVGAFLEALKPSQEALDALDPVEHEVA